MGCSRSTRAASTRRWRAHHALAGDCQDPFWSADGTRLFYASLAGSSLGLWSVGATGGTAQVVVQRGGRRAFARRPTLALLREDAHQGNFSFSLWLSSPPGSEPKRYPDASLAARRFGKGYLRYSPDGRKLGLLRGHDLGDAPAEQGYSNPELWILPQPAGPARRVLPRSRVMPDPAPFGWMPDARRVVFAGEFLARTPGKHLWMADTEPTDPAAHRLGRQRGTPGPLARRAPDRIHGRRGALRPRWRSRSTGSPARPVVSTSRTEADPAWSPSGGQYAYVTDRTGRQEIWLRSAGGDFERPVVTDASFGGAQTLLLSGLAFSPDGQRLAYQRRGPDGFRIWISTVAGGQAVRLSQDEGYQDAPTWSPDGAWIAFTSLRKGRWSLARVGTAGASRP